MLNQSSKRPAVVVVVLALNLVVVVSVIMLNQTKKRASRAGHNAGAHSCEAEKIDQGAGERVGCKCICN
jgi:hypothetical protein